MNINRSIILVGSNVKPYTGLKNAGQALKEIDPSLQSLPESLSPDVNHPGKAPYLNQLFLLHTSLGAEELTARFKIMEKKLGRRPEDKQKGTVVIDIDLVWFNDQLLKPFEAKIPYVQEGVENFAQKIEHYGLVHP